jgi:hypothetical protein
MELDFGRIGGMLDRGGYILQTASCARVHRKYTLPRPQRNQYITVGKIDGWKDEHMNDDIRISGQRFCFSHDDGNDDDDDDDDV